MKKIILDKRLSSTVDLLGSENIVVDLGCDHGYVANYLVENNLSEKVYATDISEPSLRKNEEFAFSRGNDEKVISLLGDGLLPLEDKEFDAVIMAGIGGELIERIIRDSRDKLEDKTLILQPMTARRELRMYLVSNGFKIIDESIVKDGNKYYEIIKANTGKQDKSKSNFYFGDNLVKSSNPVLVEYIESLIEQNRDFILKARKSKTEKAAKRIIFLEKEVEFFEEILNECKFK